MADVQVTCINKQPRHNPHANNFYTRVNGKRADVGVVHGPNGDYVRTHADDVWNDNFLTLTECW